MFVRPELRRGDVDIRIKAPQSLVETLDLIANSLGISRQDVILVALDGYCEELRHISTVVAGSMAAQRNRNRIETEKERQ